MTKNEAAQILALCATFDFRDAGELDIEGWHELLKDKEYEAIRQLVLQWYGTHRERVMPSDLLLPMSWIPLPPDKEWMRPGNP